VIGLPAIRPILLRVISDQGCKFPRTPGRTTPPGQGGQDRTCRRKLPAGRLPAISASAIGRTENRRSRELVHRGKGGRQKLLSRQSIAAHFKIGGTPTEKAAH